MIQYCKDFLHKSDTADCKAKLLIAKDRDV